MTNIIKYLENENKCLIRFKDASLTFLKELCEKDVSGLSLFESKREAIIKALGVFDEKISEAISNQWLRRKTNRRTRGRRRG